MLPLALVVAAVLFALAGLTCTNTRNPAVFLPRMFAASFSPEIALIGLVGAILGTLGRSAPVAVGYGLVALAAGVPVARIWSTPEVLSEAFGENARMDGAARTGLAAEVGLKLVQE